MINLAGVEEADKRIIEELFLAGIGIVRVEKSEGEVNYSITGELGDWTFIRAWYYWIASAPEGKGLPLDIASKLHEKTYPKKLEKTTSQKLTGKLSELQDTADALIQKNGRSTMTAWKGC